MELKVHPELSRPLTALWSTPNTALVVLSGSGRKFVDDVMFATLLLLFMNCYMNSVVTFSFSYNRTSKNVIFGGQQSMWSVSANLFKSTRVTCLFFEWQLGYYIFKPCWFGQNTLLSQSHSINIIPIWPKYSLHNLQQWLAPTSHMYNYNKKRNIILTNIKNIKKIGGIVATSSPLSSPVPK